MGVGDVQSMIFYLSNKMNVFIVAFLSAKNFIKLKFLKLD